jgi:hypothetical protein
MMMVDLSWKALLLLELLAGIMVIIVVWWYYYLVDIIIGIVFVVCANVCVQVLVSEILLVKSGTWIRSLLVFVS